VSEARVRPLRDFALALGFLTVLPVGREWPDEGAPQAVGYYPWVGWVLGAGAWLVAWLLQLLGSFSAAALLVGGVVIVAGWALATRMLHWDGLADTADGLWGSFERDRRLEIMRDSRVGSFGVTAVVLTALLQVSATGAVLVAGRLWVLVCAAVLGRAAAALAAWTLPAARTEGLGLTAVERPGAYPAVVAGLAVFGLFVLAHLTAPAVTFLTTMGVGVATAVVVPRLLARRIGGMTGDLFGASVLIVEAVVLTAGALLP